MLQLGALIYACFDIQRFFCLVRHLKQLSHRLFRHALGSLSLRDDVASLCDVLLQIQASKRQESASHPTSLSASWKVSAASLQLE